MKKEIIVLFSEFIPTVSACDKVGTAGARFYR